MISVIKCRLLMCWVSRMCVCLSVLDEHKEFGCHIFLMSLDWFPRAEQKEQCVCQYLQETWSLFSSHLFVLLFFSCRLCLINVLPEVCVWVVYAGVCLLLCSGGCLCAAATPAWVLWSGLILGKACCLRALYPCRTVHTHTLCPRAYILCHSVSVKGWELV